MKYIHAIWILTMTATCLVHAYDRVKPSETMRRADLAVKNGDRSELPFLEATACAEDTEITDRWRTTDAYLKIATLDESAGFMRRHFMERCSEMGGSPTLIKFLEKAAKEEKDADGATRENLYTFLLEVVQTSDYHGADCASKADLFLLERVPGYADSKQRAALARYVTIGNEFMVDRFKPVKAHFDAIPTSKRVDLRDRFPGLPPHPEDPPKPSSPYLWPVLGIIAVLVALILALILRKVRKGKQ